MCRLARRVAIINGDVPFRRAIFEDRNAGKLVSSVCQQVFSRRRVIARANVWRCLYPKEIGPLQLSLEQDVSVVVATVCLPQRRARVSRLVVLLRERLPAACRRPRSSIFACHRCPRIQEESLENC